MRPTGGALFGLKFVPTNLLQFVRPDALRVTHLFPWIFFPAKALVLGHLLYDTRDWSSSIPASMPVIFLLGLVGVVVVFRPTRPRDRSRAHDHVHGGAPEPSTVAEPESTPGIAALRLPLVGAAAGTAGILTIAFIAERYLADAMPLLLLASVAGWHYVCSRWSGIPGKTRTVGAVLLVLLALFELWTTFSLSLFYQRELGPAVTIPQRAGMVAFQEQVHRSFPGDRRPTSGSCPDCPPAPRPSTWLWSGIAPPCTSTTGIRGNPSSSEPLEALSGSR